MLHDMHRTPLFYSVVVSLEYSPIQVSFKRVWTRAAPCELHWTGERGGRSAQATLITVVCALWGPRSGRPVSFAGPFKANPQESILACIWNNTFMIEL